MFLVQTRRKKIKKKKIKIKVILIKIQMMNLISLHRQIMKIKQMILISPMLRVKQAVAWTCWIILVLQILIMVTTTMVIIKII